MCNMEHFSCQYVIIGIALIYPNHAHGDGGQPNVSDLVPCTGTSGTTNCGGYDEIIALTTEPVNIFDQSTHNLSTFPNFFIGWGTVPNEREMLYISDVFMFIENQDTKEYLASFTNDFQRMLVTETLRNCPYIRLCNFTFGLLPSGKSCCGTCSCRPDCRLNGNCCPDYPGFLEVPSPSLGVMETCMTRLIQNRIIINNYFLTPYQKQKVRAYQSCPQNTDTNLQSLCADDYDTFPTISLDDTIPVTNNVTMKTYRNRHCAQCNGADLSHVTQWEVRIACLMDGSEFSLDDLLSGILHGDSKCQVRFDPPVGVNITHCAHFTSCNESGFWWDFVSEWEEACGLYEIQIGIADFGGTLIYYANPFCALCNGIIIDRLNCPEYTFPLEPSIPFTFSGLLRLDSRDNPDTSSQTVCGPGLLYDDITKRCKNVTCPYHCTFKNQRCEPFLETSETIGYRVFSIIRPSVNLTLEEAYDLMPALMSKYEAIINNSDVGKICRKQNTMILKDGLYENITMSIVDRIEFLYDLEPKLDMFRKLPENASSIDETVQTLLGLSDHIIFINSSLETAVQFGIYLKDDTRDFSTQIPVKLFLNWNKRGTSVSLETLVSLQFVERNENVIPYLQWFGFSNDLYCIFLGTMVRPLTMRLCPMFSVNMIEVGLINTPYGLRFERREDTLIESSHYVADDTSPHVVRMCVDTYRQVFKAVATHTIKDNVFHSAELAVSMTSVSVSSVCLGISLLAYCCLPELQTLPGKNNMALIVSLLLAQGFYLLGSYSKLDTDLFWCKLVGGLTHFFWLMSLFWMNVCTFHMFCVLIKMRVAASVFTMKRYIQYHGYCFCMSVVFVGVNILASMLTSDLIDVGYGDMRCYVSTQMMLNITFGLPAALVVISNLVMFLAIIVKLKRANSTSNHFIQERKYSIVFAKLSTITGVTWLFGFVYMWTGITAFSFVFIILNGSQGLFLMLSFVCNARTVNIIKQRRKLVTGTN